MTTASYDSDVDRLVALANRLTRERNAALDRLQEIRDLVGGYPPQTEDATRLRDLVWEAVTAE